MTQAAVSPQDTGTAQRPAVAWPQLRRGVFMVIALFLFLGPAPGQLFGQHSPFLREWIMYSGVGIGMPKGIFSVHDQTGEVTDYTPLQAAGLERYPPISHYKFDRRIFAAEDLSRFAAPLCARLSQDQRLSFDGAVGTRIGWVQVTQDDVCQDQAVLQ